MPPRLSETYQPGALVEILFEQDGAERWIAGRVVLHQHPGLWVRTDNGGAWFVTNTRRIRHQSLTTQSDALDKDRPEA